MTTLAHSLQRHAYLYQPVLCQMQVAVILIGSLFWIEARLHGDAFQASVFGAFVLQFPAEMWAGVMMGAGALCWITYRQALRDITSQPGFPTSVTWPIKPDN